MIRARTTIRNATGRSRCRDRSRGRKRNRARRTDRGVVLHFGKFKGERIAEVPAWYLGWLVDIRHSDVGEAAGRELLRREAQRA